MSYKETIDNYLCDEGNEYTQANDMWEDFFMEKQDEIDERPWIQADHYLLHFACWLCSSSTLSKLLDNVDNQIKSKIYI